MDVTSFRMVLCRDQGRQRRQTNTTTNEHDDKCITIPVAGDSGRKHYRSSVSKVLCGGQRRRWHLVLLVVVGISTSFLFNSWETIQEMLNDALSVVKREDEISWPEPQQKSKEQQQPCASNNNGNNNNFEDIVTSKVLVLEHLQSWSRFPIETQFTRHVLELLYHRSLSNNIDVMECKTTINISPSRGTSESPLVDCDDGPRRYDCAIMKRIFANRTIPYNVTFGFDYWDLIRPTKYYETHCWGNSAVDGHFSVPNMQDRRKMGTFATNSAQYSQKYEYPFQVDKVPWQERDTVPIWRGTLRQLEDGKRVRRVVDLARWKAVNFSHYHPELLNARIGKEIPEKEMKQLMSMASNTSAEDLFLTEIVPVKQRLYHEEYQAALVVVGIGAAFRISDHLRTKTAVILQKATHEEWFTKFMKPYVHYIPVKNDMSDLMESLVWVKEHPVEVKEIAERGYDFWKFYLTFDRHEDHFYELLYRLSELQHWRNVVGQELKVISLEYSPQNDTAHIPDDIVRCGEELLFESIGNSNETRHRELVNSQSLSSSQASVKITT